MYPANATHVPGMRGGRSSPWNDDGKTVGRLLCDSSQALKILATALR